MTFGEEVKFYQCAINRKHDTFGQWSQRHLDSLFLPYREPNYSLESIIHVFMNRLGQQYETIMFMETQMRDSLFNAELKLMEQEKAASKNK